PSSSPLSVVLHLPTRRSTSPRDPHSFPTRRSSDLENYARAQRGAQSGRRLETGHMRLSRALGIAGLMLVLGVTPCLAMAPPFPRSEEHTSELQSRENLVCRLLLEKKKQIRFTLQL